MRAYHLTRSLRLLCALCLALTVLSADFDGAAGASYIDQFVHRPPDLGKGRLNASYARLPLSFEVNQGQTGNSVKFLTRGDGYQLLLTANGATLALRDGARRGRTRMSVLRMKLANANPTPRVEPLDELSGKSNYLIGADPRRWRTDVANYARVKYTAVYPGVDLIYYGNQRQLEYDFVLQPGANPQQIKLTFAGARRMRIDANGDLVLRTAGGEVRQRRPVVYQEADGVKQFIAGRYVRRGQRAVGFEIGAYDTSRPLAWIPTAHN